jgi:hypothetical protein
VVEGLPLPQADRMSAELNNIVKNERIFITNTFLWSCQIMSNRLSAFIIEWSGRGYNRGLKGGNAVTNI